MPNITTPKAPAIWPKLNEADTKFDADGVYEVKLAFNGDEPGYDTMISKIESVIDAEFDKKVKELTEDGKAAIAKKLTKVSPINEEEDSETGEPTGRTLLKFKMKASGTSKKTGKRWTRKPDIFNAKGVKLKAPPSIGGGSVLKVSFDPAGYYNAKDKVVGASLRLEGVQIIELVSFGSKNADAYGFGAEDGYDGEDDGEMEAQTPGGAAGADEDDDL